MNPEDLKDIADRLLKWIEREGFIGWDPFDGLNSPFLRNIAHWNRWLGIIPLQVIKRSPINLRPLLLVPKTINAKAMGLLLTSSVRRYQIWGEEKDITRALRIAAWLKENTSNGYHGTCWGYPFDWAKRAFYAPRGTPTIVNTAFIGHALLDLYTITKDESWLNLVRSSCEFICKDLNRSKGKKGFCFSYTPIDRSQVHNANLLGASLIARTGKMACYPELMNIAIESAAFSIEAQQPDGSWSYGEAQNESWVDSFHTGYNLIALKQLFETIEDSSLQKALDKGYRYYLDHFFFPDGTVKFYHNKTEPLDAHAFAHAIICLCEMSNIKETPPGLAEKVLNKMVDLFWNPDGYFYWQIHHGILYRLPCMRWVQSWALLSLITYLQKQIKHTNSMT